jgi:hypothetical protein
MLHFEKVFEPPQNSQSESNSWGFNGMTTEQEMGGDERTSNN